MKDDFPVLQTVTDFALSSTPDDIPKSTLQWAALLLLDTIGIAASAGPMDAGRIARDTAAALYGSGGGPDSAQMLFDGRRVSVAGAAFAAATQTDNLDGHDGFAPVKGHIGAAVVPAFVALAQSHPDMTGPEALTALTVGYEIAGRAGLSLHATVSDYHTSGAWNALGVAALTARVRGMSADQMRHALGIAEYHGPRSQMMREIATPTMLHDGSSMGAMVGISAAIMAEKGFTGAPAITIEAPDVAAYWSDLGQFWITENQYIKPYPICRWAHAVIDGVRIIMNTHSLSPDQVAGITAETFHEASCLYDGIPQTTGQAQYSMHFAVAVQALYGRIGVQHIDGEGLSDPAVAAFMKKIVVTECDKHNQTFPNHRMADVAVTTTDGRKFAAIDVHASGGTEAPWSRENITEKFMEFAEPAIGKERSEAINRAVLRLSDADSRFADVGKLLIPPPG